MKQPLKTMVVPATALFAIALSAMTMSNARAEEFCRTDYASGGIRICGFASLEQCKAMISGRGGTCDVNPFPVQAGSAYASMRQPHARSGHKAKKPAA